MATMGSSDYEKQVAWKKALTQPMVFSKVEEKVGVFTFGSSMVKDYMLSNGYTIDDKGFYHKGGEKYLAAGSFSDSFSEKGEKKYYFNYSDKSC